MKRVLAVLAVILGVSCSGRAAVDWNTRGIAFEKGGQRADAARAYAEAARLAPEVPEYHCNLGAALGRLGQYDAAALEFERALTLRPGYPEASRGLTITRVAIAGRQAAAFQQ